MGEIKKKKTDKYDCLKEKIHLECTEHLMTEQKDEI